MSEPSAEVFKGKISLEFDPKDIDRFIDALSRASTGALDLDKDIERLEKRFVGAAQDMSKVSSAATANAAATGAASRANDKFYSELPRARYALYDVARTWGLVSTATLGAATAVGAVGVAFERDFAQVVRTTGVVGEAVGELRTDLEDLSTQIPESFGNITEIAALGGQLDIAADGIEDFTSVTARLTATTNLSAEAAGTALGRFQALLGVPSHEFENLASSILKVGVNSVATETQIVQIATQISSMGNFAGLTADQVVGLAGALASTGTQPELARGTITRLFTLMSQAVAGTTDNLEDFARVARVSADDFRNAWGTEAFADTFQKFLHGIGQEGDAAVQTLRDLGITSVRDVPALLRLADAGDVVAQSFSDAEAGFREGTELADQYGIVAETVASKLTKFGNTLQVIMATIADDSSLNVFGILLDLVQKLAEAFLSFARNPFGKAVIGIVTAATALVGVFAAGRAASALFTASLYAMITAQRSLATTAGVAGLTTRQLAMNFITTGNAAGGAAVATRGFTIALRSLQSATVVGAVLTGIAIAMEAFSSSARNAEESAEKFFGSASSYMDAIKKDTEALETAGAFRTIPLELDKATKATRDSKEELYEWAGLSGPVKSAGEDMAEGIGDAADETERFTLAIGENFRAQMAETLVSGKDFQQIWQEFGPTLEAAGFSLDEFFTRALSEEGGGVAYVREMLEGAKEDIKNFELEFDSATNTVVKSSLEQQDALYATEAAIKAFLGVAEGIDPIIDGNVAQADAWTKIMGDSEDATKGAGDALKDLTDDLGNAAQAQIDLINTTLASENALFALGEAIHTNGLDFSTVSEAGRANLSALMQVVNALIAETVANGGNAADAIAGLMEALSAMGVNVARDLGFLSDMLGALGGPSGMGGVVDATDRAMRGIQSGFGSAAPRAVNRTRDAVKEVQKEIRTTTDYANDLATVFRDAFRFRFGREIARDNTNQMWDDMKKKIKDAKDRAKELRLEIMAIRAAQASRQSRKAILLQQLEVERMYGNTVAEQQVLAELGELDAEIAQGNKDLKDTMKELKEAQEEAKASTEGNTDAARDQREAIRDLLESYAAQIEEAANNGASQEELRKLTRKLKKEFEDQADKIGLTKDEIGKYKKSFDDMDKIVAKVPRDVTTEFKANASPAEKALANFKAKMDKTRKQVEKPFKIRGTFDSKINSNVTSLKAAQQALSEALKSQAKAYKEQPGGGTRVDYWDNKVNYWRKVLAQYKGFAAGGFTGRGGKYDAAGVVHRGEFVFPKEFVNQSTGLPYANVLGSMAHAMGAMSTGSGGGGQIQVVEILPSQIDQLARAVSTHLSINGNVIAQTTNGYNASQYNRGAG